MTERGRRDGREGRGGRATSSHAIDTRLVPARNSDPWFDIDVDATPDRPFDASHGQRDETSHVARRRVSTVDPNEITLCDLIDMIEEEPLPVGDGVGAHLGDPALDSVARMARAASLAPLRIVPSPTPPPARSRSRRPRVVLPPPPSRGTLIATAVVAGLATLACVAVVALIVTVRSRTGRIEPRVLSPSLSDLSTPTPATAHATTSTSVPANASPTAPSAASASPRVDIASLPRPSSGTVIGLPARRLWIDGHLAGEGTAVVRCGPHSVQVGSAGTPRDVDVPCGSSIRVAP